MLKATVLPVSTSKGWTCCCSGTATLISGGGGGWNLFSGLQPANAAATKGSKIRLRYNMVRTTLPRDTGRKR